MRFPRLRFRIRWFLLLIAILATLLGPGYRAYRRFTAPTFFKTYYVGDLVSDASEANGFAAKVNASVPRDPWNRNRGVTPFPSVAVSSYATRRTAIGTLGSGFASDGTG